MVSLGSWMNEILIDWGVDPKLANMFDETIIAVLMIGVSIGLDYLCQAIFVGGMKHYTKRAPHQWNTLLMKRRVVHHLIHILPGILVYFLFIIRKSKFPQNPKRSVRFSGKRTKRSVQKRKARNTQKAETKVL